ncbi:GMC oxidoreductase, partial [Acinetobacter johnsonii]|uniref:GMC oxidoreductase n=1 Tax=Acinetobacter johnsonii TaxID=40214 RepID=UPI0029354F7C
ILSLRQVGHLISRVIRISLFYQNSTCFVSAYFLKHHLLFNYMSTEQDWQEFRDAIRITREIMQQPALDPYRGEEISPGKDVSSDAELDEFVRNHAETAYHPSCSCKMGEDDMAVVDGQGRVHGLQSLRVVDASIMPLIITGNLNATTIMMAEKIADQIRGHQALPRSTAPFYRTEIA